MKARRRHLSLALAALVAAAGVPAAMAASGGGAAPLASGSALHAGRTLQECKEIWPHWTEEECESWVKEGTTTTTTTTATTSTSSSSKSSSSTSTTTSTNTASKTTSTSSSYGSEPTSTSTSTSSGWPTTGTFSNGEAGSKEGGTGGRRHCKARRTRRRSSTCARSAAAAVVGTKRAGKLGSILEAGPHGHTVYAFMGDRRNRSVCRGACEKLWPPVTTRGKPKASRGVKSKSLGTIGRGHGARQVTYDGRPLYYYLPDRSRKDVLGEGIRSFGARWYALSPRGKIVK